MTIDPVLLARAAPGSTLRHSSQRLIEEKRFD
jgi:hypothetical protein